MTIKTPPLRVSQERTRILGVGCGGAAQVPWGDYRELSRLFQMPVTKEFEITISTDHIPYGIYVHFDRRNGTISNETNPPGRALVAYMKLGWNDFMYRNMIVSGHYWMSVTSVQAVIPSVSFSIPVRVEYDAEIEVVAASLEEAKAIVEHKLLSQVSLTNPRPANRTHVRINYTEYEKLRDTKEGPRIGAFYLCSSTSRFQISGQVVQLVEIKTARQLGVKDQFGDVYYTSPNNLTYHHG